MSVWPVGQGGIKVAATVRRVSAVATTFEGGVHVNFLILVASVVTLSVNPAAHFS